MVLNALDWLIHWQWSDLSPGEKPHLRYPSVWKWIQAEGVQLPLTSISDLIEREKRQREYTELWRYLFVHHIAGLPEDEQQAFVAGCHPSQTHDLAEAADPVAEQLQIELAARGINVEVSVARYLDGRTVLDVPLRDWPLEGQWPDDLSFFRGYEAHLYVCTPERSTPNYQ